MQNLMLGLAPPSSPPTRRPATDRIGTHGLWRVTPSLRRRHGATSATAIALFTVLVSPPFTPVTALASPAQAVAEESGAAPRESSSVPGEAEPGTDGPATAAPRGVTPPEYRGPAMPREDPSVHNLLERAEEFFGKEEWAKGLDLLDGTLSGRELSPVATPRTDETPATPARQVVQAIARGLPGLRRIVLRAGGVVVAPAAVGQPPAPATSPEGTGATPNRPPDPEQLLHTDDGVHYVPLVREVRSLLLGLPSGARRIYRETYEPPARERLESALELPFETSLSELHGLAIRYPLAPAGQKALAALGARALDLGRGSLAADAFRRLLELRETDGAARPSAPERASLLTRLALSSFLAGRASEGEALLAKLSSEEADTVVPLGGEPVRGRDIAEHPVLRRWRPPPAESPPDARSVRWECPSASPDHAAIEVRGELNPPAGSRAAWIHFFRGADRTAPNAAETLSLEAVPPLRERQFPLAYPSSQIASADGLIFVRSDEHLLALDTRTGKIRWRVDPSQGATVAPASATRVPGVGGPSPWQSYQNLGGNSITLLDDLVIVLDRQSPPLYDREGKLRYEPNRLLAYSARSGKLKWRLGGPEEPKTSIRPMAFTAPPTSTPSGGLVVPATRSDAAYMIGLDARGGVLWIRRLYDYNAGYIQQHRNSVSHGASLAVSGTTAIAAPGHGAVTAVDTENGRIEWITRYRTASATRSGTVWVPGHPLVADDDDDGVDVVVVAPHDSAFLIALERESGKTLWEIAPEGGVHQLLGAVDGKVLVAGATVRALDLRSGEERFESKTFARAAGRGFVTGDRVYLPLEDGLAILDSQTGESLAELGWTDRRMPPVRPGNLALAAMPSGEEPTPRAGPLRLVATAPWGVALVEPLVESWNLVEARRGETSLARADLLVAERRHEEAMELLLRILRSARTDTSVQRIRASIVAVARGAARSGGNTALLEKLLEEPGVELEPAEDTLLRLELAHILERRDPAAAIVLYRRLLESSPLPNSSWIQAPGGGEAVLGVYLRDALRDLRLGRTGADFADAPHSPDGSGTGITEAIGQPTDAPAERRKRLLALARRWPYRPAAAEALALLLRDAALRGDLAAASAHAERLLGDYPAARRLPELVSLQGELKSALASTLTVPGSHGEVLQSRPGEGLRWTEVFWKPISEGFLVESSRGSRPLPRPLALLRGKLRLFDGESGELVGELQLPDYPDIEDAKAGLKSHIEEPAEVWRGAETTVLFTPAGIYELLFPSTGRPDDPEIARDASRVEPEGIPRLGWSRAMPHAIEELQALKPQFGWGWNILGQVPGNLFPGWVIDSHGRRGTLLSTGGDVLGLDLRTGKALFHFDALPGTPVGAPARAGDYLVTATSSPAGAIAIRLDRARRGSGDETRGVFQLETTTTVHGAHLVPETAVAIDTATAVVVLDWTTRSPLWKLTVSHPGHPVVARVTGSEIWIAHPAGRFEARSLASGRVRWSIEIPRDCMPLAVLQPDTGGDRDGNGAAEAADAYWVALATEGRSPRVFGGAQFVQSGRSLQLLCLREDGTSLARLEIGENGVTWDGRLWRAGNAWLLAYNEAGPDGQWATRVALWNPVAGDRPEEIFSHPIAGKGTGMPPRLSFVGDRAETAAFALGNAEGFGLFRLGENGDGDAAPPATNETEAAGAAAGAGATGETPGPQTRDTGDGETAGSPEAEDTPS